jgi:hypothetical protein
MRQFLMRAFVLSTLLLAGAAACLAQPGGDRGAQLMERLKKDLVLSDSVAAKVDSLMKAQRAESMKDREAYGDDREGFMEAMRARREKTDRAIESLLTDEQVAKYRKIREEMRQNFRGAPPPGAPRN